MVAEGGVAAAARPPTRYLPPAVSAPPLLVLTTLPLPPPPRVVQLSLLLRGWPCRQVCKLPRAGIRHGSWQTAAEAAAAAARPATLNTPLSLALAPPQTQLPFLCVAGTPTRSPTRSSTAAARSSTRRWCSQVTEVPPSVSPPSARAALLVAAPAEAARPSPALCRASPRSKAALLLSGAAEPATPLAPASRAAAHCTADEWGRVLRGLSVLCNSTRLGVSDLRDGVAFQHVAQARGVALPACVWRRQAGGSGHTRLRRCGHVQHFCCSTPCHARCKVLRLPSPTRSRAPCQGNSQQLLKDYMPCQHSPCAPCLRRRPCCTPTPPKCAASGSTSLKRCR